MCCKGKNELINVKSFEKYSPYNKFYRIFLLGYYSILKGFREKRNLLKPIYILIYEINIFVQWKL